ncbi:MAG: hypothetical protein WAV40_03670 [Microgenomates group bacterium]
MTTAKEIGQVTTDFIVTHGKDLSYVGGHGNSMNISGIPVYGQYNLMLPGKYDVDALTTASLLVYGCMDRRQSADVYGHLAMNGIDRIMVTSAGGAEQRNGKPGKLNLFLEKSAKRFDNDVAFWANVLLASTTHPELALLVHLNRCGGAVAQESEPVVDEWIKNGKEKNKMIGRAIDMRDAIWRATGKKGNISVGCVEIDENHRFSGLALPVV